VAEAMRLVEAGEKAGVPIMVGHHRRHNPIMRKAAEIIRSGELGTLVAVNGVWMSRKPEDYFNITWRKEAGGGPVLINAIHDIDCLRMLCGDVETVQAVTDSAVRKFPVEDTAAAVLHFANGILGTLIVSDTVATPWSWETTSRENPFYPVEPQNCYVIAGTRGSLAVPSLELRWYDGKQDWGLPLHQRRVPYEPADPYYEQMRNFSAVIAGKEEPAVSGRTGAMTLATTLAISEASRRQAPVRVADMLKS
jgi:predicted dehydrogenase